MTKKKPGKPKKLRARDDGAKPRDASASGRERRRDDRLASANLVSYASLKGAKVYSALGVAETLDISTTGMRIATRESLALGAVLEFDLKLGDSIHSLRGQLVRGSLRDDGCFEFGVSFQHVTPIAREAIRHYLTWNGHFKGVPQRGAMTGAFEGHQLADLIQMLGVGKKTGVLRIMTDYSDAFFGTMAFSEGRVVAASTSHGLKGNEAACELVGARRGSFEFRPDLPAGLVPEMSAGVDGLLLEALRRRDEGMIPPPAALLSSTDTPIGGTPTLPPSRPSSSSSSSSSGSGPRESLELDDDAPDPGAFREC